MSQTVELQSIPAPLLEDLVKAAAVLGEITLTDGGIVVAKIVPASPIVPAPNHAAHSAPVPSRRRFIPMPLD